MDKARGYTFEFPICRFYKEDILFIHSLFSHNCSNAKVIVSRYELKEVAELDALPLRKVSNVTIKGTEPDIRFSITKRRTQLYLSDIGDSTAKGMQSIIEDIVLERKIFDWIGYFIALKKGFKIPKISSLKVGNIRLNFLMPVFEIIIVPIIMVLLLYYIIKIIETYLSIDSGMITLGFLLAEVVFVLCLLIMIRLDNNRHSIVYLNKSVKDLSFLDRNQDKLLIPILVGTVIAIISTSLKYL